VVATRPAPVDEVDPSDRLCPAALEPIPPHEARSTIALANIAQAADRR